MQLSTPHSLTNKTTRLRYIKQKKTPPQSSDQMTRNLSSSLPSLKIFNFNNSHLIQEWILYSNNLDIKTGNHASLSVQLILPVGTSSIKILKMLINNSLKDNQASIQTEEKENNEKIYFDIKLNDFLTLLKNFNHYKITYNPGADHYLSPSEIQEMHIFFDQLLNCVCGLLDIPYKNSYFAAFPIRNSQTIRAKYDLGSLEIFTKSEGDIELSTLQDKLIQKSQLLHEKYPKLTANEINMICSQHLSEDTQSSTSLFALATLIFSSEIDNTLDRASNQKKQKNIIMNISIAILAVVASSLYYYYLENQETVYPNSIQPHPSLANTLKHHFLPNRLI